LYICRHVSAEYRSTIAAAKILILIIIIIGLATIYIGNPYKKTLQNMQLRGLASIDTITLNLVKRVENSTI